MALMTFGTSTSPTRSEKLVWSISPPFHHSASSFSFLGPLSSCLCNGNGANTLNQRCSLSPQMSSVSLRSNSCMDKCTDLETSYQVWNLGSATILWAIIQSFYASSSPLINGAINKPMSLSCCEEQVNSYVWVWINICENSSLNIGSTIF